MAEKGENLQPQGILEPVLPNINEWPIHKLTQELDNFIPQWVENTKKRIIDNAVKSQMPLEEIIAKAAYLETIRLRTKPWRIDPPDEKEFWRDIKDQLAVIAQKKADLNGVSPETQALLHKIISRYAEEIAGHFNRSTYRFAARALPVFFNRLLNVAGARSLRRIFNNDLLIQDSLLLRGHIEELRNLTTKGTVILTPTHHSNLDSILLGWAIHAVGVPALLYGAGLNLFNARGFDYFMNRLGAYKIDRRKKNSLYLETLKMYSRMTIQRGCHTLFFPGGTRSRSGQLENDLKMGLLGTVFDAQRFNLQYPAPEKPQKIFVVPLVISYHFVLEAASLIDEHLRSVGKERYYPPKDHFPSIAKSLLFVWKLFSAKSKVVLSFGKPMDLFGNDVDEAGNSIDRNGKEVEIKEYFMSNGQIAEDNQRDSEYTKILADKIVERFYKENRVLTSHLLAFATFEILKKRHRRLDLFGLLRLSEEDTLIPYEQFIKVMERLVAKLKIMADEKKLKLSHPFNENIEYIVQHGIENIGIYHRKKVVNRNKDGDIFTEDMNLLYFYHNRLEGYGLDEWV